MSSSLTNLDPKCVASTGDAFNEPIQFRNGSREKRPNVFRRAKFSADGTAIITQTEDHCLRTFVLPTDLLDEIQEPKTISEECKFQSGSNIQNFDIYPGFDLQDPSTTLVLCTSAEAPITLRNASHYDTVHGHYPFLKSTTEQYRPGRSLTFTRSGSHFLAGSENVLAAFDVSQTGSGPITEQTLKPGRRAGQLDTVTLSRKGTVSAMGISKDGILALGTNEREIALFENDGLGSCMSTFSLSSMEGTGVTGLEWSPCGRYLLVAQRQSDIIQVYDVRGTGQEVGRLVGRSAKTTQLLGFDVVPTAVGFEVWAGGTDGLVRMWSNPGTKEGLHAPDAGMKLHESPVSSAIWHPSGVVMATCSGGRAPSHDDDESDETEDELQSTKCDNSLKIWSI